MICTVTYRGEDGVSHDSFMASIDETTPECMEDYWSQFFSNFPPTGALRIKLLLERSNSSEFPYSLELSSTVAACQQCLIADIDTIHMANDRLTEDEGDLLRKVVTALELSLKALEQVRSRLQPA